MLCIYGEELNHPGHLSHAYLGQFLYKSTFTVPREFLIILLFWRKVLPKLVLRVGCVVLEARGSDHVVVLRVGCVVLEARGGDHVVVLRVGCVVLEARGSVHLVVFRVGCVVLEARGGVHLVVLRVGCVVLEARSSVHQVILVRLKKYGDQFGRHETTLTMTVMNKLKHCCNI